MVKCLLITGTRTSAGGHPSSPSRVSVVIKTDRSEIDVPDFRSGLVRIARQRVDALGQRERALGYRDVEYKAFGVKRG